MQRNIFFIALCIGLFFGITLVLSSCSNNPKVTQDQSVATTVGSTKASVASTTKLDASTLDTTQKKQTSTTFASNLEFADLSSLPEEVTDTVLLIESNGPFPYDRDGIEFQNREKILPQKGSGYYREYTVKTPGSRDRGARRVIAGKNGERYYTDDHYDSFRQIDLEG